jgi:hypothetical protein
MINDTLSFFCCSFYASLSCFLSPVSFLNVLKLKSINLSASSTSP